MPHGESWFNLLPFYKTVEAMAASLSAPVNDEGLTWIAHGPIGVQHVFGLALVLLLIILIGLVFGLAMDYTLFTVTRMREEYVHGRPAKEAVVRGYHHGARVVTAAAIIMISVFAGFIVSPDATIKPIGFGLAFGVLLAQFGDGGDELVGGATMRM